MGKYLSYNGLQYLWSLIKAKLDTKQDKLTTVQEANLNKDHSQYATKTELATKQNTITDLASIRDGASKGSTALQEHQSLDSYATRTWVEDQQYLTQHQSLSGKQDTLTTAQLDAVNSGITSAKVASIDDKVDTLQHNTDIETIRNGYLPLSGGTLTGAVSYDNNGNIFSILPKDDLVDIGFSYDDRTGAGIGIRSKDHNDNGRLDLYARNETDSATMSLYPTGKCTVAGGHFYNGIVTSKTYTIANNVASSATVATYDISSYLPVNNYVYEVLLMGLVTTGAVSGNQATLCVYSDVLTSSCYIWLAGAKTTAAVTSTSCSSCWIPVGADRKIYVKDTSSTPTGTYRLYARAYKRMYLP